MTLKTRVPLVLASGSPRRRDLLRELDLEFEILVREVKEVVPVGMSPTAVAEHLALFKAQAYNDIAVDHVVITADTLVTLGNEILGKPNSHAESVQMLKDLSGTVNWVISGVCINFAGQCRVFHEITKVHFRNLKRWEIEYYIQKFRPFDKAGAYGIQEWIGMVGIEHMEGDYYNVVGLPLARLWRELQPWLVDGHRP